MQKIKNNSPKSDSVEDDLKKLINESKFSEAVLFLFKQQSENWELLKDGLSSLHKIDTKKFYFDGYEVQTQFNPLRINSTMANVSPEAVKKRQCFLCIENLPREQKGIIYKEKYIILCNPFPIFSVHMTISSIEHKPQRIKKPFEDLLQLSKDFSELTIVYNGPESGASAPDHLHFQACRKDSLPIDIDYEGMKNEFGEEVITGEVSVTAIDDGMRRILSLEGISDSSVSRTFNRIYSLYAHIAKSHVEPMMNIICTYENESGWRVIIFFRKKHRPNAYFEENDGNILVSPASIDLGGVLITPLEKDFRKIDKELITSIFREVSIGKEEFEYIKTKLKE